LHYFLDWHRVAKGLGCVRVSLRTLAKSRASKRSGEHARDCPPNVLPFAASYRVYGGAVRRYAAMGPGSVTARTARIWTWREALEDAYAIFVSSLLIVGGLLLLSSAGLITGGLSGIALLLSYLMPIQPGIALILLSIPFYLFAGRGMGAGFLTKTIAASVCLSLFSALAPLALRVEVVSKPIAAIAAGAMLGMGTLSLARHGAGVGGFGALFLWLERHHGVNPGKIQICVDIVIFAVSCAIITPTDLLWSALTTVTGSLILILWQRPPFVRD
jgi:uncharacterized membrane-anchored protein YitT (DUF2179 family)